MQSAYERRIALPLLRRYLLLGLGSTIPVSRMRAQTNQDATRIPFLLSCVRSTKNPWVNWWNEGGLTFAKSIGGELRYGLEEDQGRTEHAKEYIQKLVAQTEGNVVVNIDCGNVDQAKSLGELCYSSGVYFVTHFNKPDDYRPWLRNPFYVAHLKADQQRYGRDTARHLLSEMGGTGEFVALGGAVGDAAARERLEGLTEIRQAHRGWRQLDLQDANWASSSAFEIMRWFLARFGNRIKGVWSANDAMALGAVEALRSHGLAGQVPLTGIDGTTEGIKAIKRGELSATLAIDAFWRGGAGLSMAYRAKLGLVSPDKLEKSQREFYGPAYLLTKTNVDRYIEYWTNGSSKVDWRQPVGSIPNEIPAQ